MRRQEVRVASRWITITTALAALVPASRALAQNQDAFEWTGVVERGRTLEVRGINGDIRVTAAPGASALVRAVKHGEDDAPRDVRIEVVQDEKGVLVCAVYPTPRGERPNQCRRDGRGQKIHDNDVNVDFEVRIPAGVHLAAGTVNGRIEASGVTGDARVSSVNGEVRVASSGSVSAHSVNGSIEATMGSARWDGTLEFGTVNGSVTLTLPAAVGAVVEGTMVNGDFESDFPMLVEAGRTWGPKRFEGRIGDGGGRLSIETVNGSIILRRAG